MRALYHLPTSPFSRRVRLALALKKLPVELKDTRKDPQNLETARRLCAVETLPLLVEADGRFLGDSCKIVHYLDQVYPGAPIWPRGDDALPALEIASLVDSALDIVVNLGTRYFVLSSHEAWASVRSERVSRAQRALDVLGARVSALSLSTVTGAGWCGADIWLYTATKWLENLPVRAQTQANIAQIMSLGWTLPAGLSRWADAHREREDVRALDA